MEISEKSLALALLHIQRCNHKKVQEILQSISHTHLKQLLQENWQTLFEPTQKTKTATFSELTIQLFPLHPDLSAVIFVDLITQSKVVTLNKVLKAFLDYLPASMGTDCNWASMVLQKTLELYFCKYFESVDVGKVVLDRATNEAMKILVRSYLSQLQMLQLKEKTGERIVEKESIVIESDGEDKDSQQEKFGKTCKSYFDEAGNKTDNFLLCKYRYEYLEKMPPFQVEITGKLYESCLENYTSKPPTKPNEEADCVLKKLQAILCSQILPKQLITEVNAFLNFNEDLRGNASLRSITMNVNDAIAFLIDSCPQCLLQFAKVGSCGWFFFRVCCLKILVF